MLSETDFNKLCSNAGLFLCIIGMEFYLRINVI